MANRDANKIQRILKDFSSNVGSSSKKPTNYIIAQIVPNVGTLSAFLDDEPLVVDVINNGHIAMINDIPSNSVIDFTYELGGDTVQIVFNGVEVPVSGDIVVDFSLTVTDNGFLYINDQTNK